MGWVPHLGAGASDTLNVVASGNIAALGSPAISNVEIGYLTGTSGNDLVTLSGAQLNAIIIGAGTVNLGAGTGDTINLTSTSTDLNTLGATDASIQGVELILCFYRFGRSYDHAQRTDRGLLDHRKR